MGILELLIVLVVICWLLGWLVFPVAGGLVHILLVVIIILVLVRLLSGRSIV